MKFLLVAILFAVLVYALVRTIERRNGRGTAGPGHPSRNRPKGPIRPTAPDDDPEFLRNLERERRRRQAESGEDKGDSPGA